MKRHEKATGAEAFRQHYRSIFGERWEGLEATLAMPSDSVAIDLGGTEPYFLDSASVFAAESLNLPEDGEILDACAAPGGKSLIIASRMAGNNLKLIANELSSDRRRRLSEVLDRSLPPEIRSRVVVAGEDAGAMCRRNVGRFGAILLDAPCSSERHVLADSVALAAWSPSRPRSLAQRQWALLSSAFLMLKPGACLVYSTCALDPVENDGVAGRLAAKYKGLVEYDPPHGQIGQASDAGEKTAFGFFIAPDLACGAGPMYICRVRKKSQH